MFQYSWPPTFMFLLITPGTALYCCASNTVPKETSQQALGQFRKETKSTEHLQVGFLGCGHNTEADLKD